MTRSEDFDYEEGHDEDEDDGFVQHGVESRVALRVIQVDEDGGAQVEKGDDKIEEMEWSDVVLECLIVLRETMRRGW